MNTKNGTRHSLESPHCHIVCTKRVHSFLERSTVPAFIIRNRKAMMTTLSHFIPPHSANKWSGHRDFLREQDRLHHLVRRQRRVHPRYPGTTYPGACCVFLLCSFPCCRRTKIRENDLQCSYRVYICCAWRRVEEVARYRPARIVGNASLFICTSYHSNGLKKGTQIMEREMPMEIQRESASQPRPRECERRKQRHTLSHCPIPLKR